MPERRCEAIVEGGERCRARPMRESRLCFFHDPETAQEAADARRVGGLRRRREGTVEGAYEFEGLGTVEQIRRLVEIAIVDTLSLENSIARARTLAYLAQTALKSLEVGELESRLAELEGALGSRVQGRRR